MTLRATLALRHGHLRDADTLARRALDEVDRQHHSGAMNALAARLTLAAVCRERFELDAARELLTDALAVCEQAGEARWAAAFACELIQVTLAEGRHLDALDHLGHLRRVDALDPLPERLRRKLDRVEVHCRLAMRDLEGALLILDSIPPALRRDETLARLELSSGRPDRARKRLADAARRPELRQAEIERLVLLARAELQLGEPCRADQSLRRALAQGRPDRYIRVFVDDAPDLLVLLRGIAGDNPDTYLSELIRRAQPPVAWSNTPPVTYCVEPLTDREREVLGHLRSHLRTAEIAAIMYISVNTIKTHTKAVYRKLGVESRSEAVRVAQHHGLL